LTRSDLVYILLSTWLQSLEQHAGVYAPVRIC